LGIKSSVPVSAPNAGSADGHAPGDCREKTRVHHGIHDLPDIAEARIVERHVAQPERSNADLIGLAYDVDVVLQGWAGTVRVAFQRGDETEGQLVRLEYLREAAVARQS
jgi:hypothetical protein